MDVLTAATLAVAAIATSRFYPVSNLAGKLMLPYLAWLAFANALNFAILKLNGSMVRKLPLLDFSSGHAQAGSSGSAMRYIAHRAAGFMAVCMQPCLILFAFCSLSSRWLMGHTSLHGSASSA